MRKALVVLSGGQDSTTALYWAKQHYEEVHAITIDYGQRHKVEIEAAKKIADLAHVASHEVIEVGPILQGTSPLVNADQPVGQYDSLSDLPGGIEPTFVPARNIFFLAIAANRAAVLGVHAIVIGVCQADYGGYPDCRQEFIDSMTLSLHLGVHGSEKLPIAPIYTPLMDLTKADSVRLAANLPGCMDALAFSHTCYNGQYPPDPFNHASLLRAKGFHEAGLPDPLILRAKKEGLLPADYPDDGLVEGTKFGARVDAPPAEKKVEEIEQRHEEEPTA